MEENRPGAERRLHDPGFGRDLSVRVVVYTYRGAAIRIISARKATSAERAAYEE